MTIMYRKMRTVMAAMLLSAGSVASAADADAPAVHARAAKIDAGINLDHRAAMSRQRIDRPDCDLAVDPVEQPHPREARLGNLRRADRVIGARGFSPAELVQP